MGWTATAPGLPAGPNPPEGVRLLIIRWPLVRIQAGRLLSGRSALRLPVSVQRALDLHEPDQVADDREQEPQPVDAADGAAAAVEVLLHVPDL